MIAVMAGRVWHVCDDCHVCLQHALLQVPWPCAPQRAASAELGSVPRGRHTRMESEKQREGLEQRGTQVGAESTESLSRRLNTKVLHWYDQFDRGSGPFHFEVRKERPTQRIHLMCIRPAVVCVCEGSGVTSERSWELGLALGGSEGLVHVE